MNMIQSIRWFGFHEDRSPVRAVGASVGYLGLPAPVAGQWERRNLQYLKGKGKGRTEIMGSHVRPNEVSNGSHGEDGEDGEDGGAARFLMT